MITLADIAGLPGFRRDAMAEMLSQQPRTVLEALRIRGIGRRTTRELLRRGVLIDPEGVQRRPLTSDELEATCAEPRPSCLVLLHAHMVRPGPR